MLSLKEKMENGIPANQKTVDELVQIGADMGLRYADYVQEMKAADQ